MRFTILMILLIPLTLIATAVAMSINPVEDPNQTHIVEGPYEGPDIIKLSMSRGGYRVPKFFEIELDGSLYTLQTDLYDDAVYHTLTQEAIAQICDVIHKYSVKSWDGFDKVDRSALDGEDFYLYITFSDGSRISAQGSNRFPRDYREVMHELEAILEDESSYPE